MEEEAYQLQVGSTSVNIISLDICMCVEVSQLANRMQRSTLPCTAVAGTRPSLTSNVCADDLGVSAVCQVAALAPKIEAMEASWNRLRAISGAETPEQVVEYWQGKNASRS